MAFAQQRLGDPPKNTASESRRNIAIRICLYELVCVGVSTGAFSFFSFRGVMYYIAVTFLFGVPMGTDVNRRLTVHPLGGFGLRGEGAG